MFKISIFKAVLLTFSLASFGASANAHEIWLERDGAGPVRIYMGPAEGPHPDHGKEIDKVKNVKVFMQDQTKTVTLAQKKDHFEAMVKEGGDVRLFSDQIWLPWKNNDGQMQGAIFQARVGRSEVKSFLDLELVPVSSDSNIFTVTYKGQPLADNHVMVVSPDKWQKTFESDSNGRIVIPMTKKGRFILISHHDVAEKREITGQKVEKLTYISTLSFVAE